MSYPPPVPRTTFQGHRVEGNIKVDDVHANIFQGHRVSGHTNTGFKGTVRLMMSAWRSRLPGALEGGYEHGVEGTKCRSVGRLGRLCIVAAAEITAKPKWAVKTGPGATSGTAAKAL